MTTEQELRQKLRKIAALVEGATCIGEPIRVRQAVQQADRILRTDYLLDHMHVGHYPSLDETISAGYDC
jgi:hypothetical protein